VATITDNASGENTKITVRTSKAIDGHFDGGFRWGGEGDTMPTTLIKSIIVQSEEKQLFVPLSAYSDLGDPHKISLKRNTAGFEITITGGDAGGSYNAVLVFEGGWLTYRRVAHGEFPDQAWEETRYFYNILDN
jgi:hypothetical protein